MILFIFTSCQNDVSRNHFDDLVKHYHTQFINCLETLGADTLPFEYEQFLQRVDIEAPAEVIHSLIMAVPILGKKRVQSIDTQGDVLEIEGAVTQEAREKIVNLVAEFGKRGWIK